MSGVVSYILVSVPLKVNTNIIQGFGDIKILKFFIGNMMWGEYILENEGSCNAHTTNVSTCWPPHSTNNKQNLSLSMLSLTDLSMQLHVLQRMVQPLPLTVQ